MKIAITVNTSWNIYNFRMGLIKSFLENGHEVIAIAPEDHFSPLLIKAGCRFFPLQMENKGSNPFKDLSLIRQLIKIYKDSKPDIVLQFTIKPNIYGTLAASYLSIPVINNVSGLGTVFIHPNLTSRIARILYKVSFRKAQKVFFQNSEDLQLFVSNNLVRKEQTGLLPGSGVNLEKFKPRPYSRNRPFTFLLIARLLFDKGIMEYIEAIKILKKSSADLKFLLMGQVDESASLGVPQQLLDQWVKEQLIEYIPFSKEVGPAIEMADCVVLPSYREGTSKTLLEAAAMGKPLIATNVPGCKEVVIDGVNGYLCQVKDAKDLANKMQKMSQLSDGHLEALGQKSRELVVHKYDEKIVIEAYRAEIDKILSSKKHGKD